MMMTVKKQAIQQLQAAGEKFVSDFESTHDSVIRLRSKEPGVLWKTFGELTYAAISEFSGPNSMENGSPLLFRLRTNSCPPPAIYYHLRSPAVRSKLGVSSKPLLANDPVLEITALPEEIDKFGKWLFEWFEDKFAKRSQIPEPPVQLLALNVGANLQSLVKDVTKIGYNWPSNLYLWTPKAYEIFENWLSK